MRKKAKLTPDHRRCTNCSEFLVPLFYEFMIDESSPSVKVNVKDAITSLYGLRYLEASSSPMIQNDDDSKTYLCRPCFETLTTLYKPWAKFNRLRSTDSDLAIKLKRIDELFELIHQRVQACRNMETNNSNNHNNTSDDDDDDDDSNVQSDDSSPVHDKITGILKTEAVDVNEKKYVPADEEEKEQVPNFCEINLSFEVDDPAAFTQDDEEEEKEMDVEDNVSEDPLDINCAHSSETLNNSNKNDDQSSSKQAEEETLTNSNSFRRTCDVCYKVFSRSTSKKTFELHQATHRNKPPIQCICCDKSFPESFMLYSHLRVHANPSPYNCPDCKKKFSSKPKLLDHFKEEHPQFSLQMLSDFDSVHCTLCAQTFQLPTLLDKHKKTHLTRYEHAVDRKKLLCRFCGKGSLNELYWLQHLGTHGDWSCSFCQKKFPTLGNLTSHHNKRLRSLAQAQEEDPRSFKDTLTCRVPSCSAQFCYFRELKAHEKESHPEKPFTCSKCQVSFSLAFNYKKHHKLCIRSVKTKCPLLTNCDKKNVVFDTPEVLREHLLSHARRVNQEEAVGKCGNRYKYKFECPLCSKYCMSLGMLKSHFRVHTGEARKCHEMHPGGKGAKKARKKFERCPKCPKTFRAPEFLEKHLASHRQHYDLKCPDCPRVFANQDPLTAHIRRVHQKLPAYPCIHPGCEEVFNTRKFLFSHCSHTGHDRSTISSMDCGNSEEVSVKREPVLVKEEKQDQILDEEEEEEKDDEEEEEEEEELEDDDDDESF